jgi:uncharacterized protein (TIGR02145 family)
MLITFMLSAQGSFYDGRDGQEYKIIVVDKISWMAENVNYNTTESWAYKNKDKKAKKYGRLYTWYDAKYEACPEGWHLPSEKEWQKLIDFYGGDLTAGYMLQITGPTMFNAKYAGFKNEYGVFLDIGNSANFWTSKSCDKDDAWKVYIDRDFNSIVQDYINKETGLSVRCVKN